MKKRILKNWVVRVLSFIILSWMMFVTTTCEALGTSKTYDYIFTIWTILAIISVTLLKLHTNYLD